MEDGDANSDLTWLIAEVAQIVAQPEDSIEPSVTLGAYGLDSLSAVQLSIAIEERYGMRIESPLEWLSLPVHEAALRVTSLRANAQVRYAEGGP